MAVLEAENLTVRFGYRTVVKNVTWKVEAGENWAFLGLNGCGKTTLLSVLAGYEGQTRGNLKLFDTVVTEENRSVLRQRIGFVSSSFFNRIFQREPVLDILLSGKTSGYYPDPARVRLRDVRRARELLALYGMEEQLRSSYDLLSNGQRQCVLLARALMKENDLLILDEPCEGLDILRRDLFLQQLEGFCKPSVSVLYVTHHTEELGAQFQKALFMREGKVLFTGRREEMFTPEQLESLFRQKVSVQQAGGRVFLEFDWEGKLTP